MACPSLPIGFIEPHPIQAAAGEGFEVAHDPLRPNLRFHHSVHVSGPHMGRQQTPATMCTHLMNRFQYGVAANLIRWANKQDVPILSLDTPSGLDVTSGLAHDPTIRATATLTLALPKQGLLNPQSAVYVGELYLADISVPPELYAKMGVTVPPLFAEQNIIRVELQESS